MGHLLRTFSKLIAAQFPQQGTESLELRLPLLRTALWVVLAILSITIIFPSIFLVIWGLMGTDIVGILSSPPSLFWFKKVLTSPEWIVSLSYSIVLGVIVSVLGTLILINHFFFVRKAPPWIERSTYVLILFPVILPGVIYALALRLFGSALGLHESFLLAIGHLVFVLPIQYFFFEAAEEAIPNDMLEAAETLGATPFTALLRVYLPSALGAARAALLVGFFFSFDEIIIASFVIDSPRATVPKRLWDEAVRSMDPSPAVVSTLLLLLWLTLAISIWLLVFFLKRYASREDSWR